MCHSTHVEAREHTCGVGTLLLLCGSQGLNSGHRAWQQAPLPSEPSNQPAQNIFLELLNSCHLHYSAHQPAIISHLDDGDRHTAGHPFLLCPSGSFFVSITRKNILQCKYNTLLHPY